MQEVRSKCARVPDDKVSRPEAHLCYLDVLKRRAPEDCPGDPGPRADYAYLSHLQPRLAQHAGGGRR
jgi:hypothetical protein